MPTDSVLKMKRPSASTPNTPSYAMPPEGTKRLVVDLPISKHRQLKQKAAERGVSVKALVLELLSQQGI